MHQVQQYLTIKSTGTPSYNQERALESVKATFLSVPESSSCRCKWFEITSSQPRLRDFGASFEEPLKSFTDGQTIGHVVLIGGVERKVRKGPRHTEHHISQDARATRFLWQKQQRESQEKLIAIRNYNLYPRARTHRAKIRIRRPFPPLSLLSANPANPANASHHFRPLIPLTRKIRTFSDITTVLGLPGATKFCVYHRVSLAKPHIPRKWFYKDVIKRCEDW